MDLLRDIFRSLRLEGCVLFDSSLSAPWDIEAEASNRPKFHLVVEGFTWVQCSTFGSPICLRAGDVLFIKEEKFVNLVDQPICGCRERTDPPPSADVHPPKCRLIHGTFGLDHQTSHPLIDTLPAHIQFSISDKQRSFWGTVGQMADEPDFIPAGSTAAIDRLCELLLVIIVGSHVSVEPDMPGFATAHGDAVTRNALQLIHEHPNEHWTLDSLAQASGLSRSAFAARFHEFVGMPPMAYLTSWRMHKAKRLLQNRSNQVSDVAHQVGYSSETAFSRAFKQFFGESPGSSRTSSEH